MLATCLSALCSASPALAQSTARKGPAQTSVKPPQPSKDEKGSIAIYAGLFAIVGMAVGASMIPSKRGHQD
jgi:hypothetical protein